MRPAFRDRRFASYLVAANLTLIALASFGPIYFVTGLAALAGVEIALAMRAPGWTPIRARATR